MRGAAVIPANAGIQSWSAPARTCEVFVSIGITAEGYPAAELPLTARAACAAVIEINPDKTPITRHAEFALHGLSGVVLPELQARLAVAG